MCRSLNLEQREAHTALDSRSVLQSRRPALRPAMLLWSSVLVIAHNPFTSNVAHLTPANWTMLEQSPHLWLVNVCRQS